MGNEDRSNQSSRAQAKKWVYETRGDRLAIGEVGWWRSTDGGIAKKESNQIRKRIQDRNPLMEKPVCRPFVHGELPYERFQSIGITTPLAQPPVVLFAGSQMPAIEIEMSHWPKPVPHKNRLTAQHKKDLSTRVEARVERLLGSPICKGAPSESLAKSWHGRRVLRNFAFACRVLMDANVCSLLRPRR